MSKNPEGSRSGYITIRIPSRSFYAAWKDLQHLGEIVSQNTSAQDAGADYISNVSHIKNLLKEQATLQGMLDDARQVQRTRGLGEAYKTMLDTQAKLAEISGELQAAEDRLAQLADQIQRSTITLNLSEHPTVESTGFSWGTGAAYQSALTVLLTGLRNTLNLAIFLGVTSLLWAPWVLVALILLYRHRKHLAASHAKPAGRN
jgi:hypothetical protein